MIQGIKIVLPTPAFKVLPAQSQKPLVKLYKTMLTEDYKRYLKFHSSKERQTDFIFSGGLKSAYDLREMEGLRLVWNFIKKINFYSTKIKVNNQSIYK